MQRSERDSDCPNVPNRSRHQQRKIVLEVKCHIHSDHHRHLEGSRSTAYESGATVAMALANNATAAFPWASRSPMIPEPTTMASRITVPIAKPLMPCRASLGASDLVEFFLESKMTQRLEWETGKQRDTAIQLSVRFEKRLSLFLFRSLDG